MSNNLIINNIECNNYQYTKELVFQSNSLGVQHSFQFIFKNIEWMGSENIFVISSDSGNYVFEGNLWMDQSNNPRSSGPNNYRVLGKLYVWDNTPSGHVTKTYVSVMNMSSESLNNLRYLDSGKRRFC